VRKKKLYSGNKLIPHVARFIFSCQELREKLCVLFRSESVVKLNQPAKQATCDTRGWSEAEPVEKLKKNFKARETGDRSMLISVARFAGSVIL